MKRRGRIVPLRDGEAELSSRLRSGGASGRGRVRIFLAVVTAGLLVVGRSPDVMARTQSHAAAGGHRAAGVSASGSHTASSRGAGSHTAGSHAGGPGVAGAHASGAHMMAHGAGPGRSSASQAALEAARAQEAQLRQQRDAEKARLVAARNVNAQAAAQAAEDRTRAAALSAATVSAAGQLQQTETKLQALEDQIDDLHDDQDRLRAELDEEARALAPVVPVAQRLSLYPADTLLTGPLSAQQEVTGLLVVRGLAKTLEARAEVLQGHRAELEALDRTLAARLDEIGAVRRQQSAQQQALAAQAGAARDAQLRSNAAARGAAAHVSQEAARATALQAAIDRIVAAEAAAMAQLQREVEAAERARKAQLAEAARRRVAARRQGGAGGGRTGSGTNAGSAVETPAVDSGGVNASVRGGRPGGGSIVAGRLISAWGEETEAGPATGNSYAVTGGASVRSPCSGTVEFAAPFRSYGQMLILNCGRDYRFVLAGLGMLNVATGQSLVKGAAIGAMPGGGGATLLVQVRHGQKSVNPAPFL
ncbi:peptidoglycan DD-metalloendopeptidase family protein [Acetobacter musti]|uniref:Peptidoglycan DD-metalloendopeptidase family protein n=1 Tax=Acetobacter musti TaxID=864732 RepID=A0ABX0JN52_9PROT|nr:peptidoglycan DD-metalloendopeptidase family protein [Acetobacter musti]NHN84237.1 peptidoglycan DD-metalloendopeptidase family protein [Acetobacter musti]